MGQDLRHDIGKPLWCFLRANRADNAGDVQGHGMRARQVSRASTNESGDVQELPSGPVPHPPAVFCERSRHLEQLQRMARAAWGAAEITKHTTAGVWPDKGAGFAKMLQDFYLPMVNEGASTNGNIALVMSEAALHIGIFADNITAVNNAVALWRKQAPVSACMCG